MVKGLNEVYSNVKYFIDASIFVVVELVEKFIEISPVINIAMNALLLYAQLFLFPTKTFQELYFNYPLFFIPYMLFASGDVLWLHGKIMNWMNWEMMKQ